METSNMEPTASQFPKSLSGFKARGIDLPETTEDFSSAALAGHKRTKVSSSVKVIEPRNGAFQAMSQDAYNQASTDLTNMRASGEAEKYGASTREFREKTSWSPLKKEKEVIKIDSGKAK